MTYDDWVKSRIANGGNPSVADPYFAGLAAWNAATLDERERCAKVADDIDEDAHIDEDADRCEFWGFRVAQEKIAAAIRAG